MGEGRVPQERRPGGTNGVAGLATEERIAKGLRTGDGEIHAVPKPISQFFFII
jgi:hypothetical protein